MKRTDLGLGIQYRFPCGCLAYPTLPQPTGSLYTNRTHQEVPSVVMQMDAPCLSARCDFKPNWALQEFGRRSKRTPKYAKYAVPLDQFNVDPLHDFLSEDTVRRIVHA